MHWYSPLLYPFSLLYDGVTALRNVMFDKGIKRSMGFSVPTLVVGNLNLGGSGKTPMVEFLIDVFQENYRLSTLSRGYGRKTRGFILAESHLGPREIGDEPFQIFSKYGQQVTVTVGEDRVKAIPEIMARRPETQMILLDDAFQHRYVRGDFNILLTTFQKPFFEDKVMPLGTLRESPKGARRADLVVVTKTPFDVGEQLKNEYFSKIRKYSDAKICFAKMVYGKPYPLNPEFTEEKKKVVLISGIANDKLLHKEVRGKYEVLARLDFGDHYQYKVKDAQKIRELVSDSGDVMILTTEKDAVKLKNPVFDNYLSEIPIFVLPIRVEMDTECLSWLKRKVEIIIAEKNRVSES